MSNTTMYLIWAGAIIIFGIAEGVTVQLVSIWFVIGSVAALAAALFGAGMPLQVIIFIAVSVAALIVTRPLVKKKLHTNAVKTNADRCIGAEGVVVEEINNLLETGQVKADGKIWTARSDKNDVVIPKNSVVLIQRIEGVKLIVSVQAKTE